MCRYRINGPRPHKAVHRANINCPALKSGAAGPRMHVCDPNERFPCQPGDCFECMKGKFCRPPGHLEEYLRPILATRHKIWPLRGVLAPSGAPRPGAPLKPFPAHNNFSRVQKTRRATPASSARSPSPPSGPSNGTRRHARRCISHYPRRPAPSPTFTDLPQLLPICHFSKGYYLATFYRPGLSFTDLAPGGIL